MPDVDKLIQAVPGYEFEEFQYSSGTIGNTYNTEILVTDAKIVDDALTLGNFSAGNTNTIFKFGVSLKGLKRPLSTNATSKTGGAVVINPPEPAVDPPPDENPEVN